MKLVILSGPDQGKLFELAPGNNFIGRAEENSVVLPSGQVSRRHACLSVIDQRIYLEDLGSSNGTYFNGQRLPNKTEVSVGSPFQVGEFIMQLTPDGKVAPLPGGPAPTPNAPPGARATIPSPSVSPALKGGRPSGPVPRPSGQVIPVRPSPVRTADSSYWRVYRRIHFLGWRGQVVLLSVFMILVIIGAGVYPLLLANQKALTQEVLKRADVLVSKLAMRNGEFIKNRQETNLDTASFLSEQGVAGAYLLGKDLNILSPVEQRGKSKQNDVSRGALRQGMMMLEEPQVMADGEAGSYHLAVPIKVWSNELGNYETYGVAYLVFKAREVAEATAATEFKFILSAVSIVVAVVIFVMLLMLLTSRPIQALHEDAELVLRGDLRGVESRARWKELNDVAISLNRSFEKYQEALASASQSSSSGSEPAAPSYMSSAAGAPTSSALAEDAKVEAISNAVNEGVVITDDMQRVVYLNKMAERLFGVPLNRVKNRHIMEVIGNQDILGAVLDLFKQVLNSEDKMASATIPVSDGGGDRKINLVVAGVKNASKQLEYAAIVIR